MLDGSGALAGLAPAEVLASQVFARHGAGGVRDVWVGGRHVLDAGRHALDSVATERFVAARRTLMA